MAPQQIPCVTWLKICKIVPRDGVKKLCWGSRFCILHDNLWMKITKQIKYFGCPKRSTHSPIFPLADFIVRPAWPKCDRNLSVLVRSVINTWQVCFLFFSVIRPKYLGILAICYPPRPGRPKLKSGGKAPNILIWSRNLENDCGGKSRDR